MMKHAFYMVLFGFAALMAYGQDIDPASDPNVQPGSPTTAKGYQLAWSDEFNGTAVDESKWKYRTGDDSRDFVKSFQSAANNTVSGGLYRCHLKKETMGSKSFTAGGIISKKTMRYGYYEARMKCPPTGGWHTSFWMMRSDGFSNIPNIELDVIENDSINLFEYSLNTHSHQPEHQRFGTKAIHTPDLSADFYVFGCEYTPTAVRYFFNGSLVQEVDATQFLHNDMNVWLTSLGLVYDWQPAIDESQLPVQAQYDYVRFFELGPYATAEITSPDPEGTTLAGTNTIAVLSVELTAHNSQNVPEVLWSKLSGPGSIDFADASATQTGARFSEEGVYEISCSAILGGVTNSTSMLISVNSPQELSFQHGIAGVDNPCSFIRQDNPNRNNGSDDEIIVGSWGGGSMRGLLSFDLGALDPDTVIQGVQLDLYNYHGSGSVGELELHALTASFDEGTGDGSSDANGADTGATWTKRTTDSVSLDVTTTTRMYTGFESIVSVTGSSGTDYVYLNTEADPGSESGVLTDERIDTGLLNLPDSATYHFGKTLSAIDVVAIIYNGSTDVAHYSQPGSLTAYDSGGSQVGSSVSVPDLSAAAFNTMDLARPSNGTTLTGRGMYGFVVPVAEFGGEPADIAYITQASALPNSVDVHFIGTATGDSSVVLAGLTPILSVSTSSSVAENWAVAGGDLSPTVLSTVPGFNATVAGYKSFESTAALVAVTQAAVDAGETLDLLIYSPSTTGDTIARFRSDDGPSMDQRPKLTISYQGRYLPEVYAGPNLAGLTNSPVALNGTAAHVDSVEWSTVSAPGSVMFSDASALTNNAAFAMPGRHWLRLRGSNALGAAYQEISVSIADERPVFSSGTLVGDSFVFEISSVTGLTYTMQVSTNLMGNWVDLYTTNAPVDPMILEAPISTNGAGFYRLILEP